MNSDINKRNERIINNLNLVYWRCQKRYYSIKYSMEDIISIGMIGLIKAADNYKESKGYSFTTYAIKCIDNEIMMTFRKNKHDNYISLDDIFLDDELSYNDILQDNMNIEEEYLNKELIYNIRKIVSTLTELEQKIYILYFINQENQSKISKELNLSQSYISRKIYSIINKTKIKLIEQNLIEIKKESNKRAGYNRKKVL